MKRSFRLGQPPRDRASYPVETKGRRHFLRQLAAGLAGGAGLALLAACGDSRTVGDQQPDLGPQSFGDGGVAPMMDAKLDTEPQPWWPDMGAPPMPDARLDLRGDTLPQPWMPDMGAAPMPDAKLDVQSKKD